jgi:predicted PurR-regulated permease PerM
MVISRTPCACEIRLNEDLTNNGWLTRERALVLVLVAVTAILLYLCFLLLTPFFSVLAWALAFAIVANPVHDRVERRVANQGIAAGISTAIVTIAMIAPLIFVGQTLFDQASDAYKQFQESGGGRWRSVIERNPTLSPIFARIERQVDIGEELGRIGREIGSRIPGVVSGSVRAAAGVLITIFTLFFFFRDRRQVLQLVRSLVPLSHAEADKLFRIVNDTIYATLYGSLVVAAVQGTMGGIMFGILGLPAPVLWGFVMAILATIPVLGTFVIWLPAAIFLILEGSVVKGLVLIAYGSCAIGLVDNFLYPHLVGSRMRLHTLPVFFSLVGGIFVFGISGLVLGPVIMALTIGVLQVWKRRTTEGRSAEEQVAPPVAG